VVRRRQGGRVRAGVASVVLLALGGCQTLSDLNPVNLYHGLVGGPIADARPPPPNADAPYPNLADTPDKPTDTDAALRKQVASGLVADRANAQYEASVSPLPPPASGPPVSRGAPPPLKADADTPSASLAAASAPPAAPAVPPPAAPFGPSPSGAPPAPIAAPAATPAATPAPPKAAPVKPVASAPLPPATPAADPSALPDMPGTPPAPPRIAGANVPRVTAPTPPPPTPPAPLPPPSAPAGATPIAFAPGSATLPPAAIGPLRALAKQRGAGSIGVTGYGEAASPDTAAQAAAVPLGFARARAIAAQLEAAGVPATAIRLDAEAAGNGAAARVLP